MSYNYRHSNWKTTLWEWIKLIMMVLSIAFGGLMVIITAVVGFVLKFADVIIRVLAVLALLKFLYNLEIFLF